MNVSKVEVVVLGLLADGPVHGYDLIERFRARSMGFWVEVGKASIYQALRRLEGAGMVAGVAQEGAEGPDRRVYRITGAGRRRLRSGLLERLEVLEPYETAAGVALGFAYLLSGDDARTALDRRERALRELLEALHAERARTNGDPEAGRAIANGQIDRQEALVMAELAWIDRSRPTRPNASATIRSRHRD
jgi:DNA-binding PadR family transcriptional regulator